MQNITYCANDLLFTFLESETRYNCLHSQVQIFAFFCAHVADYRNHKKLCFSLVPLTLSIGDLKIEDANV